MMRATIRRSCTSFAIGYHHRVYECILDSAEQVGFAFLDISIFFSMSWLIRIRPLVSFGFLAPTERMSTNRRVV